jgi:hypothetical protein
MGGLNAAKLDVLFFPDVRWRSDFLVNLGYLPREGGHHPSVPRLAFDDVESFE